MYTTVQKWGNSQAVRIPKQIADKLSLHENDPVEILFENDIIIIKKTRRHKTFAERMEGFDDSFQFSELQSGSPVGGEVL